MEATHDLTEPESCRCVECAAVHQDFIAHFGRWPTMTHEEGQQLKARRESNEASWREALR
jgi:hypothetical protein